MRQYDDYHHLTVKLETASSAPGGLLLSLRLCMGPGGIAVGCGPIERHAYISFKQVTIRAVALMHVVVAVDADVAVWAVNTLI